jgi:hypothetical protein
LGTKGRKPDSRSASARTRAASPPRLSAACTTFSRPNAKLISLDVNRPRISGGGSRRAAICRSFPRSAGPLPDAAYARELPAELRQAQTGVPAIDAAVRQLYATGTLHNHARMWLASYTVHLRKVHWRAGADWMLAHLLDGDLASNHLSWQWVASTFSHRPYIFNKENIQENGGKKWCERCQAKCPFDATYPELERRLFPS